MRVPTNGSAISSVSSKIGIGGPILSATTGTPFTQSGDSPMSDPIKNKIREGKINHQQEKNTEIPKEVLAESPKRVPIELDKTGILGTPETPGWGRTPSGAHFD